MKRNWLIFLFVFLIYSVPLFAIEEGTYSISCAANTFGYAALGAYHNSHKGILFISDSPIAADGYWVVKNIAGTAYYTIQNEHSKEYLSYCTTYSDTCKYLTHVTSISNEAQYWIFHEEGTGYRIQNVGNTSYYFNYRTSSKLLGCYASPGNDPGLFYFTAKQDSIDGGDGEGGGGEDGDDKGGEDDKERGDFETVPMTDPMLFISFRSGSMFAFPKIYIDKYEMTDSTTLRIITTWADTVVYEAVSSTSETTPALPYFTTYKFNNKFNDQLYTDAVGVDSTTTGRETLSSFTIDVACIGKWLAASFQTNDDNALVYVDSVQQKSKKTRLSFRNPVKYLLTYPYYRLIGRYPVGKGYELGYASYGREVTVQVHFLTDDDDHSVPTIYISTSDGQAITSKEYYKDATIRIDGGGVFDDMAETDILIKGRGNTSWGWAKKPYHFKFSEKQKPLGMKAGKHWVLLSNHIENSMMTNALGMKICDMAETAACNHILPVDLYLNNEYLGSYNITEKVGFGNNSVEPANESVAAMVEMDSYIDEDYFTLNNYDILCKYKEPDFSDPTTVLTQTEIQNDFNRLADRLNAGNEDYINLIDIDALCRFFLANEIILNRELKWPKSVFVYSEDVTNNPEQPDGTLLADETPWVFGPVWDLDWAWGYETSHQLYVDDAEMDYFSNIHNSRSSIKPENYWKALRYGNEEVKKAYYQIWKNFMPRLEELIEYVDDYYEYAQPSFARNYDRWYNGDRDYADNVAREKSWLRTRINTIYDKHVTHYPDEPEPVDTLYGDANGDDAISVSDIAIICSYIMGYNPEDINKKLADANRDGVITVQDICYVCDLIFSQTYAKNAVRRYALTGTDAMLHLESTTLTANETGIIPLSIHLDADNYRGIQFDLTLPEGVTMQNITINPQSVVSSSQLSFSFREVSANAYRIIANQSQAQNLQEGNLTLDLKVWNDGRDLGEENRVSAHHAILTDNTFTDERLSAASTTIRIDQATNLSSLVSRPSDSVLYDLAGRRVLNPLSGHIYIVNGKKIRW